MISIIVPVYKAEQFIHKCIDSILIQTYQDWECILINDGSPDKSGAICDNYARKDSRIIVIHQQNGGVSSARNTGIKNAKGEWITFLDSDDYWDNDYLYNLISQANSDLIISEHKRFGYSNTEYFFPESRIIDAELFINNLLKLPSYVDNYVISISYPWGKLLRADIIINNNLRFNTNMKLSEDTCFILDYISFCYNLQFIKGRKYNYYIPSSKTYKMTFSEYQNHIKGISASVCHLQRKFHNKSNTYLFSFYPMYFTAFWENLIILNKEEQAKEYEIFKHYNNLPLYILTKGYSKTRVSAIKLALLSIMMLRLISKLKNIR